MNDTQLVDGPACVCDSTRYSRRQEKTHVGLYCIGCGKWWKWEAQPITRERAAAFVLPFGKHKGKKLAEVPRDYLEWAAHKMDNARIQAMAKCLLANGYGAARPGDAFLERP